MKWNRAGLGLVLGLLLAGCGGDDGPTQGQGFTVGKNRFTLTQAGVTREYFVHVPTGYNGHHAVPLVVMLHGTNQTGEQFYNISRWREVADAEGLIAVFPTALTYCHYDDDNRNGVFEPGEKVVVSKWAGGNLGTAKRPLCTQAEIDALPAGQRTLSNHPLRNDVPLAQIVLHDQALSTSGAGTQFFIRRGQRYGHILDPRTGRPAEGLYSATVLAPTATQAEGLSTAFYPALSKAHAEGPRAFRALVVRFCLLSTGAGVVAASAAAIT